MTRAEKIQKLTTPYITTFIEVLEAENWNGIPLFMQFIIKIASKKVMLDMITEIFEQTYTDCDLDNLIQFYESPTGEKNQQVLYKMSMPAYQKEIRQRLTQTVEAILESPPKEQQH